MAVTDYIAATGDNGRVILEWNAVDGATQYRIRRNDGTGWVNYIDLTETTYTDTAVTNGTTYSYAVYSYVNGAWGSASAIVSATPSTAPQNLKAKIGNGKITLTWNAVTGATQYRIRRYDGSAWVNYADLTETSYVDTAVTNGTTYKYAVYAYVDGAFGSASEVISSTPSSAADGPVLYCNEGGTRYVQEVVTVNEGGTRYTLDTIIANEGGTRYLIYEAASDEEIQIPDELVWAIRSGDTEYIIETSNNGYSERINNGAHSGVVATQIFQLPSNCTVTIELLSITLNNSAFSGGGTVAMYSANTYEEVIVDGTATLSVSNSGTTTSVTLDTPQYCMFVVTGGGGGQGGTCGITAVFNITIEVNE